MPICCRCDRTIRGTDYETIPVESASAARPDQHAHRRDDPQCSPIHARALYGWGGQALFVAVVLGLLAAIVVGTY